MNTEWIIKAALEAIYEYESFISGAGSKNIYSSADGSVSGMDKRVRDGFAKLDPDMLAEAFGISPDMEGFELFANGVYRAISNLDPELYRVLMENVGRAAAWSLGSRKKIPFIMHEASTFRVSAEYSDVDELESRMEVGGIRFFIPENAEKRDEIAQTMPNQIRALSDYAVISSFMMHDVDIAKSMASGDVAGAAAKAIASLMLSEFVVDGDYDNASGVIRRKCEDEAEGIITIGSDAGVLANEMARHGPVTAVVKQSLSGSTIGNFLKVALSDLESYCSEEVKPGSTNFYSGMRDVLRNFRLSNEREVSQSKVFDIDYDQVKTQTSLDALADEVAEWIRVVDEVKKRKENASGPVDGDGNGQGSKSLAESILSMFASDQGQGQDADAQGACGQPDDKPTEEERIAKMGIFGSDAEGARFNHLLSRVAWQAAVLADTEIDWTDYLHGALLRATGIDRTYTWSRPSRRHASMGIYVPGFKRRRRKRIALCIDESGSIDMAKLEKFNEEIIRVIDTVNPEGVDVFHFSNRVEEETLVQGEIWEAKRLLNGGTSFKAAFKAIANHMSEGQEYDAVVFFTDMEDSAYWGLKRDNVAGILPEIPEVFWIAYGGSRVMPDFGTLINMDNGELREFG